MRRESSREPPGGDRAASQAVRSHGQNHGDGLESAPRRPAGHRLLRRHGPGQCRQGIVGNTTRMRFLVCLHLPPNLHCRNRKWSVFPAQVWDVLQEAALANYRGHVGYLLSVDWSPVDPDVIWTGGKDFTVQEWRVSEQEFTKPPKGGALRLRERSLTFGKLGKARVSVSLVLTFLFRSSQGRRWST